MDAPTNQIAYRYRSTQLSDVVPQGNEAISSQAKLPPIRAMEGVCKVNLSQLRTCGNCQITEHLKLCSRCKEVRYCSIDCQRAAWVLHKFVCRPHITLEGSQSEHFPQPAPKTFPAQALNIPAHRLHTASDRGYIEALFALPLNSILDRGIGERKCRDIGQEIFDAYKALPGGSTSTARDAVIRLCDTVTLSGGDGRLRKQYIERAWDGIGDSSWRFLA